MKAALNTPSAWLALMLAFVLLAAAQTLRWAAQGESLTMDPQAQDEGLTNKLDGQNFGRLVQRDKHLAIVPSLAVSLR